MAILKKIVHRTVSDPSQLASLPPVLRRIFAARGVNQCDQLDYTLSHLLTYKSLKSIDCAAKRLTEAIRQQESIIIIGDYDADGATSTALAIRALRAFGATALDYLVPNRFTQGYGLSPKLVEIAQKRGANLIITVDNGITSTEGVAVANAFGMDVIITDHHLPGETLPDAIAIVNPNQPEDHFPSRHLAGVGVIFYLMAATRTQLVAHNWFETSALPHPLMSQFLDIVALGTVADVVTLDYNNRILVHQGLQRIRAGQTLPGIRALVEVAGRQLDTLSASDLGFVVGPRLNAAGRLEDMSIGIECLISDDPLYAMQLANTLQTLNQARRDIEQDMKTQAIECVNALNLQGALPAGLALFDPRWHQGIVGIVAGRLKDRYHRPVIAFATSDESGLLKGSARSIPGLHIRDLLATIASQQPNLIDKFGGHAAAAGLSLKQAHLDQFAACFAKQVDETLTPAQREMAYLTDGELLPEEITLELAEQIEQAGPWGQNFPEPLFDGRFTILDQRLLKNQHLKLILKHGEKCFDAIAFFVDRDQWPDEACREIHAVYRLQVNAYMGVRRLQLLLEYLIPVQHVQAVRQASYVEL